jgi:hypothetical protein
MSLSSESSFTFIKLTFLLLKALEPLMTEFYFDVFLDYSFDELALLLLVIFSSMLISSLFVFSADVGLFKTYSL